jgi:hypothetical protein
MERSMHRVLVLFALSVPGPAGAQIIEVSEIRSAGDHAPGAATVLTRPSAQIWLAGGNGNGNGNTGSNNGNGNQTNGNGNFGTGNGRGNGGGSGPRS